MRFYIADTDSNTAETIRGLLSDFHCVVDCETEVDDIALERGDFDFLRDGGYDGVITPLANQFNGLADGLVVSPRTLNVHTLFTRIAQAHGHDSTMLTIRQGDHTLEVDMMGNDVRVDELDVALSRMEYKLLRLLALDPNAVHKKDTLCDKIGCADPESLDVRIHGIRQKIAPIKVDTLHGVGFSLKDDDRAADITAPERHGITATADGVITLNGQALTLQAAAKDVLTRLLRGQAVRRKESLSTSVYISDIRSALAAASVDDDAPEGYDYIETSGGRCRLRDVPVPKKPKRVFDISNRLISLGDGRLQIDFENRVLINTDSGKKEHLSDRCAAILDYLASLPAGHGATGAEIAQARGIPNPHDMIRNIRTKIAKLGLEPENYIASGVANHNSSGYRLINAQDITPAPEEKPQDIPALAAE